MKGWRMGVLLAGLGLALGAGGCRTERGTFGNDAQPFEPEGIGGAAAEGIPPTAGEGPIHGEGLGNVVDAHGYERAPEIGPSPEEPAEPVAPSEVPSPH